MRTSLAELSLRTDCLPVVTLRQRLQDIEAAVAAAAAGARRGTTSVSWLKVDRISSIFKTCTEPKPNLQPFRFLPELPTPRPGMMS